MEVVAIVLSSVALAGSILAPLIAAGALFINRIRHSQCCGNTEVDLVEMTPRQTESTKQNTETQTINLSKDAELINKIKDLFKK